jgi:hypothetical protein
MKKMEAATFVRSALVVLSVLLVCVAASIEDGTAAAQVTYNGRVFYNASEPHRVQFDWSGIEIRASGIEGGSGHLTMLLSEPQAVGNIYEVIIDGVVHPRINTTSAKKVNAITSTLALLAVLTQRGELTVVSCRVVLCHVGFPSRLTCWRRT